jgi:Fur family ferric uptake transcriptional regulator
MLDDILHSCYQELEKGHYRLTPQREAVLLTLYRERDGHLTSYELFNKAKKIYPELGLATVYRTLDLFLEMGLLREVQFDKGLTQYELRDHQDGHHHHLVCKGCGHPQEIDGIFPKKLLDLITEETGFLITDYCCQFYGYCEKCRTNIAQDGKKTKVKELMRGEVFNDERS